VRQINIFFEEDDLNPWTLWVFYCYANALKVRYMQTNFKIAITLLATMVFSIDATAQARKDIAVFFPVTEYKGSKVWQPLPRTTDECTNIAGDLSNLYGFETEVLTNRTKNQIEDKLAALSLLKYGPQDQLLLFFSMHGYFDEAGEGGSLVPYGGLDNDPSARTWLLHSTLRYLVSVHRVAGTAFLCPLRQPTKNSFFLIFQLGATS
jgi:Caspase domain